MTEEHNLVKLHFELHNIFNIIFQYYQNDLGSFLVDMSNQAGGSLFVFDFIIESLHICIIHCLTLCMINWLSLNINGCLTLYILIFWSLQQLLFDSVHYLFTRQDNICPPRSQIWKPGWLALRGIDHFVLHPTVLKSLTSSVKGIANLKLYFAIICCAQYCMYFCIISSCKCSFNNFHVSSGLSKTCTYFNTALHWK